MQRIVVIGASLGGVQALMKLTAALPADFSAPLLIVLHIGEHRSLLPSLLARDCPLPVGPARHGEAIRPGRIYLAPSDHHLLVEDGHLALSRGAREHHTRPAIDPLFRTAALAYGPGVIGVVLTGLLDDGTAGLDAIKKRGGTTIVQDPDDAAERSMPESALRYVDIDHCVPLVVIPPLLASLAKENPAMNPLPLSEDDREDHETALMLRDGEPLAHLQAIGRPSTFTCPDCHGDLWEILHSRPQRYRCHTGHAYTSRTLQAALETTTDTAVENAFRAVQEKQLLLEHMATHARQTGALSEAEAFAVAAQRLKRQAAQLSALLSHSDADADADADSGSDVSEPFS